jgi:hypothetical protein
MAKGIAFPGHGLAAHLENLAGSRSHVGHFVAKQTALQKDADRGTDLGWRIVCEMGRDVRSRTFFPAGKRA